MFTIKTHAVRVGLLVNADIAQLVEQLICNQWVGGSNPSIGTNGAIAQLGERLPCKQEVSGSTPLSSTTVERLESLYQEIVVVSLLFLDNSF